MNRIKRTAALLMALLLMLSLSVTVTAANYNTAKNSGVRDEMCATLDGTTADGYYTGAYAYDSLSALGKT
jgi:hypothetical protein